MGAFSGQPKILNTFYPVIHTHTHTHLLNPSFALFFLLVICHDFTFLISSVQSLSRVQLFVTPWTAAHQVSLSITNSQSLLNLMSIESVMPSNHLILCCPLLLLPSVFPSIRVFSNESVLLIRCQCIGVSALASVLPKNIQDLFSLGLTGWISLQSKGVSLQQGTLKSLLQHHSSEASVLGYSAFFIVQLSHPYITTGKTIALTAGPLLAK